MCLCVWKCFRICVWGCTSGFIRVYHLNIPAPLPALHRPSPPTEPSIHTVVRTRICAHAVSIIQLVSRNFAILIIFDLWFTETARVVYPFLPRYASRFGSFSLIFRSRIVPVSSSERPVYLQCTPAGWTRIDCIKYRHYFILTKNLKKKYEKI